MVHRIYPTEQANTSGTEAAFLDLNLSINNCKVYTKIYGMVLILIFLDGDVSRRHSYVVYIYITLFASSEHLRMLVTSIPGENDGQMTMEYHGLPWQSMVIQPWSTMVDHGRPCFVKWPPMLDHGLINTMSNHGRPWSRTMVDHGRP